MITVYMDGPYLTNYNFLYQILGRSFVLMCKVLCKRVPTGYCAEHTEDALHTIVYAILKPLRTNHKLAGDPPLSREIVLSSVLLHTPHASTSTT